MLNKLIRSKILRLFFEIPLSSFERGMADDAVEQKYVPSISVALRYSMLLIPALLLLDTTIVVSVLIPTTMVAGTAWFAVSLASMKKKFENFGMELTTHLFVAFVLSLVMLLLATLASLTAILWRPHIPAWANHPVFQLIAALLAVCVVGKLLYSIFAGSLKYDINDAMLTGQNEAAERYFKQSLSLLYTTSQQLRQGMPLQVANYSLGLAFYEVFNNIKDIKASAISQIDALLETANSLIRQPAMEQRDADTIVLELIQSFIEVCVDDKDVIEHRSFKAVGFEFDCLTKNMKKSTSDKELEEQKMVDTRMAIVFSEMSNLIEEFGPSLFVKVTGKELQNET